MYPILQYLDSGSSSDAQDIPLVTKFPKLLPRERYCNNFVYENGKPLYPTNYNMPSSIHNIFVIDINSS